MNNNNSDVPYKIKKNLLAETLNSGKEIKIVFSDDKVMPGKIISFDQDMIYMETRIGKVLVPKKSIRFLIVEEYDES